MTTTKGLGLAAKEARKRKLHLLGQVEKAHQVFVDSNRASFAQMSCTKGCNACCQQVVIVTRTEAEVIAERHPTVVARAAPQLHRDAVELDGLMKWASGSSRDETQYMDKLIKAWTPRKRPCALLADDGSCAVYSARPLACRNHGVVSDPALCATNSSEAIRMEMNNLPHYFSELIRLEVATSAPGSGPMYGPLAWLLSGVVQMEKSSGNPAFKNL